VKVGAHVRRRSGGIAGAVEECHLRGADAAQIFVSNPRGWAGPRVTDEEAASFRESWAASGLGPLVAHAPYLVNIASPNKEFIAKSRGLAGSTVRACDALAIDFLVLHAGAGGPAEPAAARERAATTLRIASDNAEHVRVLVELMAGTSGAVASTIAEAAAAIEAGPWVAHVSGATPLAALDPHERRFSVHPVQTFTLDRGPEQLDGAWAAVTAETDEARGLGRELAETLGLRPFDLDDGARTLYHAGAAIASSYLVTLFRAASRLFEDAGAPPEALVPLMTRTIENGFQLTGPISRGDWAVVDAHLGALHDAHPDLEPMYRVLAEATNP
jgi:predicted short-subunit dehydrogenase-like oxidoreductase (DUF2520 family)